MKVNITEWATDSYFDLVVSQKAVSVNAYKTVIRPDVELIKTETSFPFQNQKFSNHRFWSAATVGGVTISAGFKMKWHNFGSGKFQLRLCIGILNNEAFLCRAYVKDQKSEKREMANFKIHARRLVIGNFTKKGEI